MTIYSLDVLLFLFGNYLEVFHPKMDIIKERNGKDLIEAEEMKNRWKEYTELYKKDLNELDNHDGMVTTQS